MYGVDAVFTPIIYARHQMSKNQFWTKPPNQAMAVEPDRVKKPESLRGMDPNSMVGRGPA